MSNRKIIVRVTTEDGELLDQSVVTEIADNIKAIAWRPITTEIPSRGDEEVLVIGVGR